MYIYILYIYIIYIWVWAQVRVLKLGIVLEYHENKYTQPFQKENTLVKNHDDDQIPEMW